VLRVRVPRCSISRSKSSLSFSKICITAVILSPHVAPCCISIFVTPQLDFKAAIKEEEERLEEQANISYRGERRIPEVSRGVDPSSSGELEFFMYSFHQSL
jgi:hypothetical protein